MFTNESSSHEISKVYAFKQNNQEDGVEKNDVPEQLAKSFSLDSVPSNEVACAHAVQLSSIFPTDQVPVSRDTIDERGVHLALSAAVTDCHSFFPHVQMKESECTSKQQWKWHSYSKEHESLCIAVIQRPYISLTFLTIEMGERETGSGFYQIMGCRTCGRMHHPSSKSEALCQMGLGETGGRAGADPTSVVFPKAVNSVSVISSSSCGTAEPPSLVTSHSVEQGFNAMFTSHLGSSNSNSLSTSAQSHTISFIRNTAMDVEPTHVTQAIENPNETVNFCSLNSVREEACGSQIIVLPECGLNTTGALSDQDNNNLSNVKDGLGGVLEPHKPTLDANDMCKHVWSVTPVINIPKSLGKGPESSEPFLVSAINATVQGNIDSNPPASFNNSYDKVNDSNNNVKDMYINKEETKSKLLIQSATLLKQYYASKLLTSKEGNVARRCNLSSVLCGPASNARWGIPVGLGLRGGGESSLNSGTSNWGTPPSGNSSNNNNSNSNSSSGWGGNSQGQNNTSPQNQWNSNNSNSSGSGAGNNSGSSNNNRASGGSGTSQGPSGQQNQGNTNKSNNTQSGQPPSQQPPSSQAPAQQQNGSTSWAQAAGKGLPSNQQSTTSNSSSSTAASSTTTSTVTTANATNTTSSGPTNSSGSSSGASTAGNNSSKQQLEQINTMREALFSQDGWGGQHVNQDTGWDIPPSPEPGAKDGVPVWKPNVNNGTDLWEANLRNGGQPPPSQTQKTTPWGHTPTTNIGGTWGEDDDVGDSSNVWTGVPANPGPGGTGGQWGGSTGGTSAGMWGGGGMMDPRDHLRGVVDPMRGDVGMRDPRDIRGMGDMRGGDAMMRGDPRGISGRLNGAPNDGGMWGQHAQPPHHHGPHHQQGQPPGKMVGPAGVGAAGGYPVAGVNQWTGPPPKDMGMPVTGSKPTGWDEASPPAQRRNIPNNYDDGTSLWGNPAQLQSRGGKVSHWKDMPNPNMGRGGMHCPPGMPQNRMPGNGSGSMKPDGTPLWGHPGRNGSWADGPHDTGSSGWADDPKGGAGGVNSWNEPPLTPTSWGGPKPKTPLNPGGWADADMDTSWGHPPKQGQKPLTKDIVWASKQFRILAEMGFKKEDIENALRTSNMNFDDAHEQLTTGTRMNMEAWRRHEDHSPFDLGPSHPGAGFPGPRYNPVAQQMPFAQPGPGGVNNAPSLLNNLSNPNPGLAGMNNISPVVPKLLTQQPPPQQPPSQPTPFNQAQRTPQNQPSTAQLRMLVQQIQMAVQAGYLNHQILNQPLAPQTLLLLNQLLQQIKVLQQLTQQQAVAQVQPHKGNSSAVLHISVQITKTKQQITNLQNQIASQQAIYVKQQQQQQQHHMAPQGPQPGDFFKPNMPDPLSALQSNFGELTINKEPQVASFQNQQQSRLNQWKLPSLEKDSDGPNNEFSRAPGTTTKPSLAQSHSSPNMNPLLGQGDGTWSTGSRTNSDTGWPETSGGDVTGQGDNKDPWPVTSQSGAANFTDLVPEFEPGKPWKGTQMKSIEDDPTITPGSVVRSPLSLATIKDSEIFSAGSKTSPTVSSVDTPLPPLSLSSSTWSFNPPPQTSSLGKLGGSKSTWGEAPPPTAVTSELWGAPMSKSRGPPPGLSNKTSGGSSNGWGSLGGVGGRSSSWGIQSSSWGGSTWLLLRNLTPQIDGSTLKTLCVQHGPLQNFHLYLNHGIALAKYSTREEANKAQGALNNCVLGNTTIFAESPADSEVHTLLQHLGHGAQQQPPGSSGGSWNMRGASTPSVPQSSKGAPPGDTWAPGGSQLWPPNPSASSLWGSAPLDSGADQHRATPSSLNSFLPGDLLGGESM